jgi:hypothetical protein
MFYGISLLALLSLTGSMVAAQTVQDRFIGFSVATSIGAVRGGPSAGLSEQLSDLGYAGEYYTGCGGFGVPLGLSDCDPTTKYPIQSDPGVVKSIAVRVALTRRVALGGGYAWEEDLGGAAGWDISSVWNATGLWAAAFWTLPPLRIGGGPGWYRLERQYAYDHPQVIARFGLIGEVGLEIPSDSRIFLDLAMRGHLLPTTDVDHDAIVILRPNWSHIALIAGLGMRF